MNTTTKRTTTISLDGNLLQVAKEKARAERRTLSAQLEIWIEEKLAAERGATGRAVARKVEEAAAGKEETQGGTGV
jgi:hypothetical protein